MWLVLSGFLSERTDSTRTKFLQPKTLYSSEQGRRHLSNWARDHEEEMGSPAGVSGDPDLLWVGVIPDRELGVSTAVSGRGGRKADLELLDGPTSSGISWDSFLVWKPHPWLLSDIIRVCFSLSKQGWGEWRWSRVLQSWASRREPTLLCGAIFLTQWKHWVCSGSSRTRRQPHQAVCHSFRDEAEWKAEFHSEF